MSHVLQVKWTIVPTEPPQPLLNCGRCHGAKRFRTSGKIRVNASGKLTDAWLIYKCTSCNETWNRPILERRPIGSVDPLVLEALHASDSGLVQRIAFDVEDLKRRAESVEECGDVLVFKEVADEGATPALRLEIRCVVPYPIGTRLDRLLAAELGLPRRRVRTLEDSGKVIVAPRASHALRRPVRDGMQIVIDVPESDAGRIASAARGDVVVCTPEP